jgi:hypothetical protein
MAKWEVFSVLVHDRFGALKVSAVAINLVDVQT